MGTIQQALPDVRITPQAFDKCVYENKGIFATREAAERWIEKRGIKTMKVYQCKVADHYHISHENYVPTEARIQRLESELARMKAQVEAGNKLIVTPKQDGILIQRGTPVREQMFVRAVDVPRLIELLTEVKS
jgi:hypothetical protein